MANINDVSRLAQVSKATVSRVLSGSRGVKEESRLAVLRAVETLNYRPNAVAQSLTSQSTGCIGVVCATEHIQQSTGYLQALEKQLSQQRKHLLLRFANDAPTLAAAVAELSNGWCDALIVVGARFSLPPLPDSVMCLDCLSATTSKSIGFDHQFATETAVHYLASQQRRQIALVNFAGGDAAQQVLQGYCSALETHLIPYNRQLVVEGEASVRIALQSLFNRHMPFNALLVTDDCQAQEAIDVLRQYQRQVPGQVTVFSLDGSLQWPGAPAVPSIEYSLEALAQRALALLTSDEDHSLIRGSLMAR
ncbi:LacI family DNA-binding transcriptional regulator [Serratia odorifera]|uniref:Transcriptional regulator, LacI family n=3 Tax=Gammaproteobacteria TaxID=1236 RepID=D4E4B6_SEROD|nr:LacI family DNA-binding transcriptional regulator [Serratia odorifera]EFE95325.1 transcriptional regulator, LacI family [Serratia odorifera DSM 4582]MBJ2064663.1 LacI family DNA-binding transcriptional regulator [Serratia odorifera]PNK90057.1 LacI family transcriptional regulator [Serratia odorifera]RII71068.1 LacI family transcriptional regulator [Serratia odorifera]VDZ61102.1 Galactose operon repressor [Serratia odorifera]